MLHVENPFFTRDLRAAGRRGFGVLAWPLALQSLVLLLPLWLLERVHAGSLAPADAWRGAALVLLGLGHAATCGGIGWIMGARVLGDEHRQATLEGLQLVAQHPARWLGQKLLFPLYCVGLVWAASLPLYGAIAARGHFLPVQLEPGALLAAAGGFLAFGGALLMPPEGLRSPVRRGRRVGAGWRDFFPLLLPLWITLVLLHLAGDWTAYALGVNRWPWLDLPFLGAHLRTSHGLALLLGAYALAAMTAAYASACPDERAAAPLRTLGRLAGFGTAYLLFVGYMWDGLAWQIGGTVRAFTGDAYVRSFADAEAAALAVVLPGALVLALLVLLASKPAAPRKERAKPRRQDALAAGEVRTIARFVDNAVLHRDLRVTLRRAGLTRQLLTFGLWGLAAVWMAGSMLSPGGSSGVPFTSQLAAGSSLLGTWFVIPVLLAIGGGALTHWHTERRCDTLSQLFSTPISCETVVRGRWSAALVTALPRTLPAAALFYFGAATTTPPDTMAFVNLAALWLATLGLVLSAGLAGTAQTSIRAADLLCAGCLAIYVIVGEGLVYLWKWSWSPTVLGQLDYLDLATYLVWTIPLNAVLTCALHHRAVADIEAMRRIEA
jgi:hypothetical protein